VSPRGFETSTSNSASTKELTRDLESLISPVGRARRRLITKTVTECSRLEDLPRDEEALKPCGFENLMNSRPQLPEENVKNEEKGYLDINFNKFFKGEEYNKPKTCLKATEDYGMKIRVPSANRVKGHNKENKSEGGKKITKFTSLERLYTPREMRF